MGELLVSNEQAVAADLTRLDAENQRLRDQLAENEEEISQLRTYLVVERKYEKVRSKQETNGPAPTTVSTSDTSNGKSKTRRATDMAVDLIKAKGQPIHTRDLLPQMEQRGLTVGGRNPVATLSGYLCRDEKRLVNNRKLGWKLVEWGDDTPASVRPRRQRRYRDSRQTKKTAQDQQGGTAT